MSGGFDDDEVILDVQLFHILGNLVNLEYLSIDVTDCWALPSIDGLGIAIGDKLTKLRSFHLYLGQWEEISSLTELVDGLHNAAKNGRSLKSASLRIHLCPALMPRVKLVQLCRALASHDELLDLSLDFGTMEPTLAMLATARNSRELAHRMANMPLFETS